MRLFGRIVVVFAAASAAAPTHADSQAFATLPSKACAKSEPLCVGSSFFHEERPSHIRGLGWLDYVYCLDLAGKLYDTGIRPPNIKDNQAKCPRSFYSYEYRGFWSSTRIEVRDGFIQKRASWKNLVLDP